MVQSGWTTQRRLGLKHRRPLVSLAVNQASPKRQGRFYELMRVVRGPIIRFCSASHIMNFEYTAMCTLRSKNKSRKSVLSIDSDTAGTFSSIRDRERSLSLVNCSNTAKG